MKLILTTIATVMLVGCGESQRSTPAPEAKPVEPVAEASQPEPPTAKAPDISIHDAARDGNIEVVKQHLAAGTDVNVKSENGGTPLHRAAFFNRGQKEIVELLLANGADVNAKYVDGTTPLDMATRSKHPNASAETADLLRKHGGKHGVINGAAAGGDIEAVKGFLTAGTDVNAKDAGGETPLYHAATKEIAELLIANGASVNAKTKYGRTPLHDAVFGGHKEVAELLISKGADVNAEGGGFFRTPLHDAAVFGHKEIAELLIGKGADVNANDIIGWTPLHHAAENGQREIAELLIAEGADMNANQYGETPLYIALKQPILGGEPSPSRKAIADLLRKHGGKTGEELKAEGK
ncbi:MAG: ankyrin repeat domain-containing protein [Verrucomicrobia bacterium]|jgi:ankyrin repeat protein|nr:ankyrin repeat domain-containing protein [Verrucomicrobiota bacterium]MBT7911934.1 ankyrin repeat domain-containing protein [Verrucomicrobiota bacterium]